jgi:hypothetical protein
MLPNDGGDQLRRFAPQLIEKDAYVALVRMAASGQIGDRQVSMAVTHAVTVAKVVPRNLSDRAMLVGRGEFMQAVAEQGDAAVEGDKAGSQQFLRRESHREARQSGKRFADQIAAICGRSCTSSDNEWFTRTLFLISAAARDGPTGRPMVLG